MVLPAVAGLLAPDGLAVVLAKPQFEVGPGKTDKRGVVRDAALHRATLLAAVESAEQAGLFLRALAPSPLLGGTGNREFFLLLARGQEGKIDAGAAVEAALGGGVTC